MFTIFDTIHDLFRPHLAAPSVPVVDCARLVEQGIQGVMLDLDNTLAPWRSPALFPGVREWIACVKAHGLRACIVTNASNARRVRPVADDLEIPWVTRAWKPLAGGYRRGMARLETAPATTAMIGDMLLTDIIGANALGLFTVLVAPTSAREALAARFIQRPLERLLQRGTRLQS